MRCALAGGSSEQQHAFIDSAHPHVELRLIQAKIHNTWYVEGLVPLCTIDDDPAFVTLEMFHTRKYLRPEG